MYYIIAYTYIIALIGHPYCFAISQACPLNPSPRPVTGQQELLNDFSKRFSPAIRGVVEFAKRIPGFGLLAQDDQVTLLKAGVFEVLLVRLACMFDSEVSVIQYSYFSVQFTFGSTS